MSQDRYFLIDSSSSPRTYESGYGSGVTSILTDNIINLMKQIKRFLCVISLHFKLVSLCSELMNFVKVISPVYRFFLWFIQNGDAPS